MASEKMAEASGANIDLQKYAELDIHNANISFCSCDNARWLEEIHTFPG